MTSTILHEHVPAPLRALRQWLLWRHEERGGSPTKVSYTAMGYKASVTNPEHWSDFAVVCERYRRRPDVWSGIGFVFAESDPYCGIDLDDCLDPDDAQKPWAKGLLERFGDTYAEISPSGAGVKVWCIAKLSRALRVKVQDGGIELYDRARFFAVTGQRFRSAPLDVTDAGGCRPHSPASGGHSEQGASSHRAADSV